MAGTSPNLSPRAESVAAVPGRRVVLGVTLALAVLPLLACGATEAQDSKPPNVLWIVVDQHRADVAGFAGDEHAHTPSLDRLASQSVRITDFPAGACVVDAVYLGQSYRHELTIDRARGFTCTVAEGALTCR